MIRALCVAAVLGTFSHPSVLWAAQHESAFRNPVPNKPPVPDVSGKWKPIGSDDRVMTIKVANGELTIDAIDLFCKFTDLRRPQNPDPAGLASFTANAVCDEESDTTYAKDTVTLLQVGGEVFLIDATLLLRHVNENTEPKEDERYKDRPAVVTIYRKVR